VETQPYHDLFILNTLQFVSCSTTIRRIIADTDSQSKSTIDK
jgi:hypothetical protein